MRALAWVLLILASSLARADVETLLRRAEARLAHGNAEGANELYLRVIEEAPTCGPALAWLASRERTYVGLAPHLRYLTDAEPLDEVVAARLLRELGDDVVDPSDALLRAAERAAMSASPDGDQALGPWRPWRDPDVVRSTAQADGALRSEAFPDEAHACRTALRRIAERFDRKQVRSPAAWARLAVCLRNVKEHDLADSALARAVPVTLDDRVAVAGCALDAARDPAAWWEANGEALLAGIDRDATTDGDHREMYAVLEHAFEFLGERRDLHGVASLAPAWAACGALGVRYWYQDQLAARIGWYWPLDEAYETLAVESSPAMRILCAAILARMGQHDRAIEKLESLVREDPDDVLAWDCLAGLNPHPVERGRAVLALEAAAARRGLRLGPRVMWASEAAAGLLSNGPEDVTRSRQALRERPELLWQWTRHWRGRADLAGLVDDLLFAAERLAGQRGGLDSSDAASLLEVLLEQGRPQEALRVIEMTACDEMHDLLADRDPKLHWEGVYAEIKPLLALVASRARTGERVDAFVRLLPRIEPSMQVPFAVWRLREDLAADPAFQALPSASFVLACLHDPVIDREEVRLLRRRAFRAGCRSAALLIDLAGEGEPVLAELEAVDPVAARLARARLSPGDEGLRAFLESDDITGDQFREARAELGRRLRIAERRDATTYEVVRSFPDFRVLPALDGIEDPQRYVWEILQKGPPSRWALGHAGGERRSLPPEVGAVLMERAARPVDPIDTKLRSMPVAAELAQIHPTYSDAWKAAVAHVAENEGKEGVRLLLAGPYGLNVARHLSEYAPRLSPGEAAELVRGAGRAHPLELGWSGAEETLLREAKEDPRHGEIALARLPAAMRDPKQIALTLRHVVEDRQKTALCERLLGMIEGLAPSEGLRLLQEWTGSPVDPRLAEMTIERVTSRCKGVEDRLALCGFLERLRRPEEAQPLEEELLREGGPSECLRVLHVRWSRSRPPLRAELLVGKARTGPWTTSQARDVWAEVCKAAAAQDREDLFVEALTAIWTSAPIDWDGGLSGFPCGLVWGNVSVAEMTTRLLARGNAPLPVLHFAACSPGLSEAEEIDEARGRLSKAGLVTTEEWLDATAALPRDGLLGRLRDALRLAPTKDDGAKRLLKGVCARLRTAVRTEDLLACADLWAETQPRLDITYWRGPAPRNDLALLFAERETTVPHVGVLPPPPAGVRALPASATAATLLAELGLLDAAAEEAGEAAEEAEDPVVREACRLARASLLAEVGRDGEAMAILLDLREGSTGRWLRPAAADRVEELFRQSQPARTVYIDIHLRDPGRSGDAPAADLDAWERRLCADEVPERERATEELRSLGAAALGILRGLRASRDPEVRTRVESVLEELLGP